MGEDEPFPIVFEDNHRGLSTDEALRRLEIYGRNELPEKSTPGWVIFLRCLWGPMPIALWIAIIIEFSLDNMTDAFILLAIQFGNATIGWYETTKAGDAVAALKQSLKPRATVFRDGTWQEIDAATVVPGDKVKLASGSAVPADSTVNDEPDSTVTPQIDVDEAALTGESLPVTMTPKTHLAKMGSTVVRGEVDGTVQFTGTNTVFGKTALLLQAVEADLGNIHYVLVKVMYGLTGLAMLLCIICFIFLMTYHHTDFKSAIEFVVVLLVVSIPIAIEIVVTTTLALGSKELSAKKVIVTRLSAIEMMAAVNMLCSDKTGTLTLNKMEIQQDCPIFMTGEDRESVLMYSALAAKWREPPRDALDTMVLGAAPLDRCDKYKQLEYKPFDPRVKRTEATLVGQDGVQFKVTKGAPNIVVQLCANASEIQSRVDGIITDLGSRGIRCLAIAKTVEDRWYMLGILTFLDPPRPDTKATIANAKHYGVDVKMVTGDHVLIAKEMARMLNMGTNIQTSHGLPHFPESGDPKDIPDTLGDEYGEMMENMDGFAQVHPEHKYLIVETLRQRGWTCAMTGDGVNDAPALKRADVGIAVHGATDAARAASDMVLTEPGLSVIVDAMLIARGVFQRMLSFLTYRVSATLQLVFFFFIAVFALPPKNYAAVDPAHPLEAEFFHLPVLMFMLITLLNDGTLMAIGYDRVVPQPRPQKWNLPALFFIAAVLAAVACVSSLLLLYLYLDALESYSRSFLFRIGVSALPFPRVLTAVYLKVSISDFLTLFSCRTHDGPFYEISPSPVLMIAAVSSLALSTLFAVSWPCGSFDGQYVCGLLSLDENIPALSTADMSAPLLLWVYCVFWWFVQDATKIAAYSVAVHFNWFNVRETLRHPTSLLPPSPSSANSRVPSASASLLNKAAAARRSSLADAETPMLPRTPKGAGGPRTPHLHYGATL